MHQNPKPTITRWHEDLMPALTSKVEIPRGTAIAKSVVVDSPLAWTDSGPHVRT